MIHSGEWKFTWGENGEDGNITLSAGDTISLPINMFRGFENVGDDGGLMYSILGLNSDGSAGRVIMTARQRVLTKATRPVCVGLTLRFLTLWITLFASPSVFGRANRSAYATITIQLTALFTPWLDTPKGLSKLLKSHSAKADLPGSDCAEQFILATQQNIWNARMVGDAFQAYDIDALVHASADRELQGHDAIIQFYLSFLGTFSDLKVMFDYSCEQPNKGTGTDVAVRWTMVSHCVL